MTERVEEIRRRFEDDPSSDNVFDATDVAILLTALAQAEQEVQTWKDMGDKEHALAVIFAGEREDAYRERDTARAEVERLKEHAADVDNGASQISVAWNDATIRADKAEATLARTRAALDKWEKSRSLAKEVRAALEGQDA